MMKVAWQHAQHIKHSRKRKWNQKLTFTFICYTLYFDWHFQLIWSRSSCVGCWETIFTAVGKSTGVTNNLDGDSVPCSMQESQWASIHITQAMKRAHVNGLQPRFMLVMTHGPFPVYLLLKKEGEKKRLCNRLQFLKQPSASRLRVGKHRWDCCHQATWQLTLPLISLLSCQGNKTPKLCSPTSQKMQHSGV